MERQWEERTKKETQTGANGSPRGVDDRHTGDLRIILCELKGSAAFVPFSVGEKLGTLPFARMPQCPPVLSCPEMLHFVKHRSPVVSPVLPR